MTQSEPNTAGKSDFGPPKERETELPLAEFHSIVEECAEKLQGRIRHCFRSAYNHLRKAWSLHPIDSEMALFRAITAEEEAATGLILALKQRGYDGASKLNHYNHVHKAAVSPFLDAANNLMAEANLHNLKLSISRGSRPAIRLMMDLSQMAGLGVDGMLEVDQPFNYTLSNHDTQKIHMFERQLSDVAINRGEGSIKDLIEREANRRNQLLYASDQGIPNVEFNDSVILRRRDRVHRLALITIGLLQTSQKQLFASQCLRAYLKALGKLNEAAAELDQTIGATAPVLTITQNPDGSYSKGVAYRVPASFVVSCDALVADKITVSFNITDFSNKSAGHEED